jgi:hypothetical protein
MKVPSIESIILWVDKDIGAFGAISDQRAVGMKLNEISTIEIDNAFPAKGPGWVMVAASYRWIQGWNGFCGNDRQWTKNEFEIASSMVKWLGENIGVEYKCIRGYGDA